MLQKNLLDRLDTIGKRLLRPKNAMDHHDPVLSKSKIHRRDKRHLAA
jgi:hypothetical protein